MFGKRYLRLLCTLLAFAGSLSIGHLRAQTGGQGAITGSVLDTSGAAIPKATVTATNVLTGVKTQTVATSAGVYNINPLLPGTYTLSVTSTGFSTFRQESLVVDAVTVLGFNVTLKPGSESETVTVTSAPALLNTTDASLGGTIQNDVYTALPLLIAGGQQRDITQFSNLLPGAQVNPGGRSSIIGGTGQRLGELYVDGLPLTTLSQQGDNRPVFNVVPLEAIDQIKVVTSGFSAEYQGAGLENYSLKSGTNSYHGSIFGYFRNTIFDAWSFSSKPGGGNVAKVLQNGIVVTVPGPKPAEHQTELGYAVGGPVKIPFLFNGRDKLFFYTTYDKFRSRLGVNPSASTVPTSLMRKGDFSELCTPIAGKPETNNCIGNTTKVVYPIYDPTSLASCTAHSTTGPCRYQYGYGPGSANGSAGNPTSNGLPVNVIPASQLSPITQYQASFLPPPTVDIPGTIQGNYLGGIPSGFDNWLFSQRLDYTVSPRQTISASYNQGQRHAVPYTSTTANLPVPYLATTASTVAGKIIDISHTFVVTPSIVNQLKYGYVYFGGPPVKNLTQGNAQYALSASGIKGLPAGQASDNAANTSFGGTNAPTAWVGNTPTSTNVSRTYTLLDNLSWLKNKHSMNFGGQLQWLQNNASTADGASTPTSLAWNTAETAAFTGTTYTSNTGYSYASFLLGAVGASGANRQPFSELGGRFRPGALYFQDDWKITPKLTLNLGVRWDYIPPYREVLDRFSFLNPDLTNPITGNPGSLQFAGNRGAGLSCECSQPYQTYKKNFGPRLGFAYAVDDKTVFRGGWGMLYSHAGGTGGAGGAGTGPGQAGFNTSVSFPSNPAGPSAGPAFYLNTNPGFSAQNATFGGPGYVLPGITPVTAATQAAGTGYFICGGQTISQCNGATGTSGGTGTGINYVDPYLSGRAPEFAFWNFGMQREITKDLTVTVNYVGSQSHFIAGAGGIRGLYAGQLDPQYLVIGPVNCGTALKPASCLSSPATAANLATVQAATGLSLAVPYAGYTAAASSGLNNNATIAHMLTWKPQYSGTSDFWGTNVANANYNAFQLSLAQRASHGLTFNVNYTYSRNIDDAGTQRSGYDIPASATADGVFYPKNRIDRSISINSQPQSLSIYGVYRSPFGKGGTMGERRLVRAVLGGWEVSEVYQYTSGLPLAVVGSCGATQNVGQGTCMPNANPNFHGEARKNGGWGQDITAATLGSKSYLTGGLSDTNVGTCSTDGPYCNSGAYQIGNLPRTAAYDLRGPSVFRLNAALRRTFKVTERAKFILGIDGQNLTNSVTFGNNASNNQINVNANAGTAFGTLNFASADARDFQLSGRFTF